MVLKLNILTLAVPWRQLSHWGLRVTQDAYFSLLIHNKQLLLVKLCDTLAGVEVRFGRTEPRADRQNTDEQTDVEVEIVI